jgi:hypothetical protein
MALNKTLWQEALAHYRVRNEAEFVDRVWNAGKKTPEEKWQEYRSLFAFNQRIKPNHSPGEQRLSALEWEAYYEQIQRFEAWRRSRG